MHVPIRSVPELLRPVLRVPPSEIFRFWKPRSYLAMRFIFHVATCLVLALLITDTMGVILAIPILKVKALGTIFRAAVGAVIGKRSVDDQRLDVILETDDGDCTKLLVCELAGEKNLSGAEREIVRTFTSGSVTLDSSVARYLYFIMKEMNQQRIIRTGYAVAAYVGGQYPGACKRLYKKCDLKTGELRAALRA